MKEEKLNISVIEAFPEDKKALVDEALKEAVTDSKRKIVVLDDDPTGVQTVHDIYVYTNWTKESIKKAFEAPEKLFFILTNSRGLTVSETTRLHEEIAFNVDMVSKELGMEYMIISRSDSTLRGHYPLEPELLRKGFEERNAVKIDGEILCPYFHEGGRFTIGDVHYVKYGSELVPAADTEFAGDETFGYHSSNLKEYIEEKTKGEFSKESVASVSLPELRSLDFDGIENKLEELRDFRKIVVNAVDDYDVKVFAVALYRAMSKGKHYIARCAAALVKAVGNVSSRELLSRDEMVTEKNRRGGIIVVGSHTKKTTLQLEELKKISDIHFIEMDSDLVLTPGALEEETERILREEEGYIEKGITVCVSTKRTLLKVENDTPEEALKRSVRISDAVQRCVGGLNVKPSFVVAKGGITSSDVGTKALKAVCALVLGQIEPGVPVWRVGEESRFPGTPYIIFPGNVGEVTTLHDAVKKLMGKE